MLFVEWQSGFLKIDVRSAAIYIYVIYSYDLLIFNGNPIYLHFSSSIGRHKMREKKVVTIVFQKCISTCR